MGTLTKPNVGTERITVRPATAGDLQHIKHHFGVLDTIGDPFCDVTKIQNVRLDWMIVAEVDRKYAGFLYWHSGENPFFATEITKFAHIREIQVLDRFQRRGVGKELIRHALSKLRVLGIHDVFLSTTESNAVARHLYESFGFSPFRTQIQYSLRH